MHTSYPSNEHLIYVYISSTQWASHSGLHTSHLYDKNLTMSISSAAVRSCQYYRTSSSSCRDSLTWRVSNVSAEKAKKEQRIHCNSREQAGRRTLLCDAVQPEFLGVFTNVNAHSAAHLHLSWNVRAHIAKLWYQANDDPSVWSLLGVVVHDSKELANTQKKKYRVTKRDVPRGCPHRLVRIWKCWWCRHVSSTCPSAQSPLQTV